MKLGGKRASVYNMLTMVAYQGVSAIFGFVLPNLLLCNYGASLHGYTSTVSNTMSYIALINAGLAPAAVQALYAPLSKQDNKRISQILSAVDRFYLLSGCLYTVAIIVIAVLMPHIVGEQIPKLDTISLMLVIGASNTLECFVYSKYRVLLQADQRMFIVTITDLVFYIIRVITQIILVETKCSIILVMLVPAIMVFFRTIVLVLCCRTLYREVNSHEKPDYTALSNRWSAMIHQITGLIVFNTDISLLTIFRSLIEVSIYSVYNLVFHHIYLLLNNVFSSSTVASFGHLISENKRDTLQNAYNLYEFGYCMVVTFVYSVTAVMIIPFIKVYTLEIDNINYSDSVAAVLFTAIGILNNLRIPSLTLTSASGHYKQTQNHAILEAMINIVVSLILLKPLGMYGLLIGTICSFAYRATISIIYVYKNILEISITRAIRRMIRALLTILISSVICSGMLFKHNVDNWFQWIICAAAASVVSALVTVLANYVCEVKTFHWCIRYFFDKTPTNKTETSES